MAAFNFLQWKYFFNPLDHQKFVKPAIAGSKNEMNQKKFYQVHEYRFAFSPN